jgi:hypothetical protein
LFAIPKRMLTFGAVNSLKLKEYEKDIDSGRQFH